MNALTGLLGSGPAVHYHLNLQTTCTLRPRRSRRTRARYGQRFSALVLSLQHLRLQSGKEDRNTVGPLLLTFMLALASCLLDCARACWSHACIKLISRILTQAWSIRIPASIELAIAGASWQLAFPPPVHLLLAPACSIARALARVVLAF